MNYYTIHAFSKLCGLTPQTLRNWDKNGTLIPHHKTLSGYRYYSQEQLNSILNKSEPIHNRIVIGYCRVSSAKQKDDLQRQSEAVKTYLTAQGKPFEIITDIGSGINYNKPGLIELLRRINQNEVEKVVVLYKDRLMDYGFDLFKRISEFHSTTVEVIDSTGNGVI